MPRIPRRAKAADQAPPPAEQQPGTAPTDVTTTMAPVEPGAVAATPAPVVEQAAPDATPGFRDRTRMRRRLRYLRRRRELAFRDLGGLAFDLHRFGRDRGDLLAQKLEALTAIDRELRALEDALRDRRELHDLREVGIAACARCQALHDPDANFCPGCGTSLRGATIRDPSQLAVTPADATPAGGAPATTVDPVTGATAPAPVPPAADAPAPPAEQQPTGSPAPS